MTLAWLLAGDKYAIFAFQQRGTLPFVLPLLISLIKIDQSPPLKIRLGVENRLNNCIFLTFCATNSTLCSCLEKSRTCPRCHSLV